MNIKKEKNNKGEEELVLRIPLLQESYDAANELIGNVPNLVGVIAGNDFSISQLIDLGYKDDIQEGMPIIMFDSREELEKVCEELCLSIWEMPDCAYCKKPIRGSYGMGDKGNRCYNCNKEK